MSNRLRTASLLIGLLLAGCNAQDNERLSRMGRAAAARLEAAGDNNGLASLRGRLDDTNLTNRVSARIRWDKSMEGAQITVQAQGGEVELKGTLRDAGQRQRAIDIANSTLGAESVFDALTMPHAEP